MVNERSRVSLAADLGVGCMPGTIPAVYGEFARGKPVEAMAWRWIGWWLEAAKELGQEVSGLHWQIGPTHDDRDWFDRTKVTAVNWLMVPFDQAAGLVASGTCGLRYLLAHTPAVQQNLEKFKGWPG
jgi:hypothetical protein